MIDYNKVKEVVFDVETIPQQAPLSLIQGEELAIKMNRYFKANPSATPDDGIKHRRMLMGTSPYFGEIVCICLLVIHNTGRIIEEKIIGIEQEILNRFWNILKPLPRNNTFISYNGLNFDVPFIAKRSMKHRIYPTNTNFLNTKRYQRWPHFDVYQWVTDWSPRNAVSLRLLSDFNGIPSPKEGDIKAEKVEEAFLAGKINDIANYCLRDTHATLANYNLLKNYLQ